MSRLLFVNNEYGTQLSRALKTEYGFKFIVGDKLRIKHNAEVVHSFEPHKGGDIVTILSIETSQKGRGNGYVLEEDKSHGLMGWWSQTFIEGNCELIGGK